MNNNNGIDPKKPNEENPVKDPPIHPDPTNPNPAPVEIPIDPSVPFTKPIPNTPDQPTKPSPDPEIPVPMMNNEHGLLDG